MHTTDSLTPAAELAKRNAVRFPNESQEYRQARDALLAQEIELRRQIERVAEQRRALPPGGEVTRDYRFEGKDGPVNFAGLFGDKQTLAVYSYMFGPERERPCPMCTSLLSAWDGEAARCRTAHCPRGDRTLADRAAHRLQERARLAQSEALFRSKWRVQPRLSCMAAGRRRRCRIQCFHTPRRHNPSFLERRDGVGNIRSRTGSTRRT